MAGSARASLFRFDRDLRKFYSPASPDSFCLIGVDEAGRGPLAGPVVAAAVVLPPHFHDSELDDSKKLDAKIRARLAKKIKKNSRWALGCGQVDLIDSINILQATYFAMRMAIANLIRRYPDIKPDLVIIDGLPTPPMGHPQESFVGGDGKSASIAAASVLAKVTRDRIMITLGRSYPNYGLMRHKGYATPQHRRNLMKFGPCAVHRKSFYPVSALLNPVAEFDEN